MSLQLEPFVASRFEAEGTVLIGGQSIPYRAISQDNVLYDEKGEPAGSMFTYSYFRSDVEDATDRPVMFFFNGGPGSASLWLHVGLFGPLRMKFKNPEAVNTPAIPPYYCENNELCLLDICDLVFIDPVGTGYGRLLNQDAAPTFYGMDEDAESFMVLMHGWLNQHNRWSSPKYLLGESYGTVRAGLLADKLSGNSQELASIGLNGIVLLGNAMGNASFMLEFDAEPSLLFLPTMAAANWYHNHLPGTLKEFVDEAYEFCANDYLLALFKGDAIGEEERERITDKLVYFTGLKREYIVRQNLRPNMTLSWQQLLEDQDLEIGRLDGRFTMKKGARSGKEGAAIQQYTSAFMAAMCGPVRNNLNITVNREYYAISRLDGYKWKRQAEHLPAECLAAAMRRNPDLRVLFATGYYDLACTIGQARYLATHMNYPQDRVDIKEYPSGHMVYLGEEGAAMFANDVREFILSHPGPKN